MRQGSRMVRQSPSREVRARGETSNSESDILLRRSIEGLMVSATTVFGRVKDIIQNTIRRYTNRGQASVGEA